MKHVLRYVARHGRRAMAKSLLCNTACGSAGDSLRAVHGGAEDHGDLYRTSIKAVQTAAPYSRAVKVAESGYVHSPYYEYIVKKQINLSLRKCA